MVLVTVDLHASGHLDDGPVNAHVQVTLTAHGFEEFAVMPFSAADYWRQNKDLFSFVVV